MNSTCWPTVLVVLEILATIGIVYALCSPDWKRNSEHHGTPKFYQRFQGLWLVCEHKNSGFCCQSFIEFYEILPGKLIMLGVPERQ